MNRELLARVEYPLKSEPWHLWSASFPKKGYGVVTLHRPSNVDEGVTLAGIFEAL